MAQQQGTTSVDDPWREKMKRQYLQLRMAFEGMMINKIQAQNAIVRRTVTSLQDAAFPNSASTTSETNTQGGTSMTEDDTGVVIGDRVVNNNYYYEQPGNNTTNYSDPNMWPPVTPAATQATPAASVPPAAAPNNPPPYTAPVAPAATPGETPATAGITVPGWLKNAAVLATVAGAGMGGAAAYDYLKTPPAATAPATPTIPVAVTPTKPDMPTVVDTDTDTQLLSSFRFKKPDNEPAKEQ